MVLRSAGVSAEVEARAHRQLGRVVGGRYQLERILGVGGMGTVYSAVHQITRRRVAVKLIHASVVENTPTAASRFLREAQAASSIDHPGLVAIHDAGQDDDGSLYLVLDLLEGVDLHTAIHTTELSVRQVTEIGLDVLSVLDAAHRRGFIHRDVKPANIFLEKGRDGRTVVRVLDLGIAKQTDANHITAHGSIVGTLEYMSPEQAQGHEVDGRADVWSLGAVLHAALTKKPPYAADNHFDLLKALVHGRPRSVGDLRPDLPWALVAVVDRALEPDLARRWSSASAMRGALEAVDLAVPDATTTDEPQAEGAQRAKLAKADGRGEAQASRQFGTGDLTVREAWAASVGPGQPVVPPVPSTQIVHRKRSKAWLAIPAAAVVAAAALGAAIRVRQVEPSILVDVPTPALDAPVPARVGAESPIESAPGARTESLASDDPVPAPPPPVVPRPASRSKGRITVQKRPLAPPPREALIEAARPITADEPVREYE
jgi:serine/threonine-protein kinase